MNRSQDAAVRPRPTAGRTRAGRGNDGRAFPPLVVEVSGPFACFTRPELKTERVSYPVITPSAARGVLEAIYWKPQFRYVVTRIEVLKDIDWFTVRRNEGRDGLVVTGRRVAELQRKPGQHYDIEADRDQRSTVALRDVAYRIHAQVEVKAGVDSPEEKHREQLRRRVERGACFSQPFLGCREFAADFRRPAGDAAAPIPHTADFGVMLHSIRYGPRGEESYRWFHAWMENGVIDVPEQPLADNAVAMPGLPGQRRSDRRGR